VSGMSKIMGAFISGQGLTDIPRKKLVIREGDKVWGGDGLKSSQHYPVLFGSAVGAVFCEHGPTELPLGVPSDGAVDL
jgi:hypothetical protein